MELGKLIRGRLFISLALAVAIGIVLLAGVASVVAWQGFGNLGHDVDARLSAGGRELVDDLETTGTELTAAVQGAAAASATALGQQLQSRLATEVEHTGGQLEASLLATGDALAELLALASRDAIIGRNFAALVGLVKVANGNADVVYAVYLRPDGSPFTRYVDRGKPKIEAWLAQGEGRTPLDKVLAAARSDPGIHEIRKAIRHDDKPLGEILLGISTAKVAAASRELQERFEALQRDSATAVDGVLAEGLQTTVTKLREHFVHLEEENAQLLAATSQAVRDTTGGILRSQVLIYLVTGLVVLVALCAFFLVRVSRPLDQLGWCMEDIAAGKGDLTRRIAEKGRDETTRVAAAFNAFVARIQETMQHARAVTDRVATAAEALATVAQQNSVSVNEQQGQTQQVATAITEMAATVREIAQSAEATAASTRAADTGARDGKRVVGETVEAINQLAGDVEQAAAVIDRLASDSAAIGAVLDVIRSVAEQTNLLALNAAIEAARAGEQGRGFAVVADEVRTLASRTQESTSEIQQMIEKLQLGSNEAVGVMQHGLESARRTVPEAIRAGEALDHIVANIASINDMSGQIASAAEEQSAVAGELDRSVAQIATLSEDAASGTRQTSESSRELAGLAEELRGLVAQFRV